VHQDGQAVYKYAVRKMVETSSKLLEANHIGEVIWPVSSPSGEQAHHFVYGGAPGLPLERSDHSILIASETTTAATIPLGHCRQPWMSIGSEGEPGVLASVGAGFTVGAACFAGRCKKARR